MPHLRYMYKDAVVPRVAAPESLIAVSQGLSAERQRLAGMADPHCSVEPLFQTGDRLQPWRTLIERLSR
jgi:hypothetical protein